MRIRRSLMIAAFALLAASLALAGLEPGIARAHERRTVSKYQLVVGFENEPAVQGELNGASLRVTVPDEGGRPVEGLADSLRVQVAFGGGQPKAFPLRAVRNDPGAYRADFIPTRAGTYIFTFSGTIEGTDVNERFESGPGRFNDVDPAESIQFPEPVPLANDVARTARAANERAAEAEAAAASSRTIGIAGVGVGILGVLLGAAALATSANRRQAAARMLAKSDAR